MHISLRSLSLTGVRKFVLGECAHPEVEMDHHHLVIVLLAGEMVRRMLVKDVFLAFGDNELQT